MSSRINFHPLLLLLEASSKKDVKEIIAVSNADDEQVSVSIVTEKLGCDDRQAQNLLSSLQCLTKKLNEQEETYEARAAIFPESFHNKLRDLLIKLTAIRSASSRERTSSVSTSEAGSDVCGSDRDSTTGIVKAAVTETSSSDSVSVASKNIDDEPQMSSSGIEPLSSTPSQVGSNQDGGSGNNKSQDTLTKVQKPSVPSRVKPPVASKKPAVPLDKSHGDSVSTKAVTEKAKIEDRGDVDQIKVKTSGPPATALLNVRQEHPNVISSFPRLHDFKCNLVHVEERNDGTDPIRMVEEGGEDRIKVVKVCRISLDVIHGGNIHRQEVSLNLQDLEQTIQSMSLIKEQLFNKLTTKS